MTDSATRHVLIVEDTVEVANLIQITLRKLGISMGHAITGDEALQMVTEHEPDLILLDIGMPGMNGWEFLEKLRAQTTRQIPIVVLTAYTDAANRQTGEMMQVDTFLAKPVIPAKLREVVQSHLDLS